MQYERKHIRNIRSVAFFLAPTAFAPVDDKDSSTVNTVPGDDRTIYGQGADSQQTADHKGPPGMVQMLYPATNVDGGFISAHALYWALQAGMHQRIAGVFNLSSEKKIIGGSIDLKTMGLNPTLKYASPEGLGTIENGRYQVQMELLPWDAKAAAFGSP